VKEALMRLGYLRTSWVEASIDQNLHRFVSRRIATTRLYSSAGVPDERVLGAVDAFVVGSDQVWRSPYGDVPSYLLDFLPGGDPRPRWSYAASFGRDDIEEYGDELVCVSRDLVRRFQGVSVRESSGVRIARDFWGVQAMHHVDPTLLLDRSHYEDLARQAVDPIRSGQVVDYILDETEFSSMILADTARVLQRDHASLSVRASDARKFRGNSRRPRRPSVEAWLGAIGNARLVVTDSFHGTVFSILFNVPFVTVVNRDRGASRFTDLLETLGLQSRLVEPGMADIDAIALAPISWELANERILSERRRALSYLSDMMMSTRLTSRR
jgi:hypothetical protein